MANMGKSPEECLPHSYRSPWHVARPSTGVLYYRRTMGNSPFVVHALNVRLRKEEKDNVTRQIQWEKDYKDSSFQALCCVCYPQELNNAHEFLAATLELNKPCTNEYIMSNPVASNGSNWRLD